MSFRSLILLVFLSVTSSSLLFSQETVGHFTLGVQSGALVPFGDNKGIASERMGISNALVFKYFPTDHFSMGITLRMMNNRFQGQTTATDVPITQVPFTFDFDWYLTKGRLKPYLGIGLGLSFFTVTPVAGLVNTLKEIPDTYTTPAYLGAVRAGFSYQLSDRFSLTTEGTFLKVSEPGEDFLWKQNDGTIYRQFSNKATFTIGIHYHFDE
jgi:outer membrane protein W